MRVSQIAIVVAGLVAVSAVPVTADETQPHPVAEAIPVELGIITVIGTRDALDLVPGSGDILDRELLEAAHVFTVNEALRKVPGLLARDEEGFGLRPNIGVRGLNPTRSTKVLLLEDGLPLTFAPYGDNASYYHPPIDRFDHIEVLKGSGQILFGPQTVGAVINYITPSPPESPAGLIGISGGGHDFGEVHGEWGTTIGRTGIALNATRKVADGARAHMRFRVSDVNVKVRHTLTDGQDLTFRASYYDENSDVPYSGLTLAEYTADPYGNPFTHDNFQAYRWSMSATHGWRFADAATLRTSVYYTFFNRDWWRQSSNSAQRPNDASDPACGSMANLDGGCGNEGRLREFWTAGVEPRLTLDLAPFGLAGQTQLGVRFHREHQFRIQANGDTPDARSPGTGVNAGIRENNVRDVEALSGFAQVRFDIGAVSVTPGVRYEHIEYDRENRLNGARGASSLSQFIPGLGATWNARDEVTLFAGVHRGFAPPRVEDIVGSAGGSVDLDAELSWNYELGMRAEPVAGLRLEATMFRMDFQNQIVPASVAGGSGATLTSAGQTRHQGFELGLNADSRELFGTAQSYFGRLVWTWLPDAKYRGSRFSSIPGFANVDVSGNRLPYAPEQLLAATLGFAHDSGFSAQVEVTYQSASFSDDLNTVAVSANGQRGRIAPYALVNVAVNQTLLDGRLTLFATVKNANDRLYVADMSRGLIPGMPRLVQGGFTWRFN
jgi:Fe(3+) dicitrate transport protein